MVQIDYVLYSGRVKNFQNRAVDREAGAVFIPRIKVVNEDFFSKM